MPKILIVTRWDTEAKNRLANWKPLIAEHGRSHAYFCEKMSTNYGLRGNKERITIMNVFLFSISLAA
jgi:hypothetical protein